MTQPKYDCALYCGFGVEEIANLLVGTKSVYVHDLIYLVWPHPCAVRLYRRRDMRQWCAAASAEAHDGH